MNAPTLKSLARLTRLDFLDGMGVALAADEVTFVHLRKRLTYITLVSHRTFPLEGVGEQRRAALSLAARKFIAETQTPTDHVFVSLPRETALLGHLTVPEAARGDLERSGRACGGSGGG